MCSIPQMAAPDKATPAILHSSATLLQLIERRQTECNAAVKGLDDFCKGLTSAIVRLESKIDALALKLDAALANPKPLNTAAASMASASTAVPAHQLALEESRKLRDHAEVHHEAAMEALAAYYYGRGDKIRAETAAYVARCNESARFNMGSSLAKDSK